MKLLHVLNPSLKRKDTTFPLVAEVEGTHEELLTLVDKLYDSNELLCPKVEMHHISPAIVCVKKDNGEVELRYSNILKVLIYVKSDDTAQALNDVASNILHLIE